MTVGRCGLCKENPALPLEVAYATPPGGAPTQVCATCLQAWINRHGDSVSVGASIRRPPPGSAVEWTHSICLPCWNRDNPDREPVALKERNPARCCFCAGPAIHGIYVRESPLSDRLACGGNHQEW